MDDVRERVLDAAGKALARRALSRAALAERLAKVASPDVCQAVLDDLERLGYVDDEALALALAEQRLASGWGPGRVEADLERLAVGDSALRAGVRAAEAGEEEAARALLASRTAAGPHAGPAARVAGAARLHRRGGRERARRARRLMPPPAVERHAETMRRIWDDGTLQEPPSAGDEAFGIDDAYAISAELLRRREDAGWQRLGRKIGFTNIAVMREYGMSAPIFGYVYDRTLIHGESGRAALSLAGTVQPKIEPEIVFKLRRSPPRTRDPVALLAAVEWIAQGFELVQCHYPNWVFAAPDAIADSGFHARYAVGAPTPVDEDDVARPADDLAGFRIELLLNGEVAAEGGGELVLGSPLLALAHLIEVLAGLPGHPPLAAGELVTTGTLTAALPVVPDRPGRPASAGWGSRRWSCS